MIVAKVQMTSYKAFIRVLKLYNNNNNNNNNNNLQ